MRRTLRKQQEQLNVGICLKRFCLLYLLQAKTTIHAGEDQLGKSRSTTFWHRTCYASRPQWPHSLEEMVSLLKVQHLLTPDLLCKSNTVTHSLEEMVQHLLTVTPQWGSDILLTQESCQWKFLTVKVPQPSQWHVFSERSDALQNGG